MSFGKNKSKSSSSTSQSFNQNSTTSLSPRAWGLLSGRLDDLGQREYQALDPNAYKAYENPYQQEVIDAVTADINANRAVAQNADRAAMAGAGAFGDDRRAILEAERAGQFDRTLATTLAGLRSRGFETAQGVAAGENTARNQYDQNAQALINQLLSILGNETTTTSSGTSQGTTKGKTSGFNLGLSWSDQYGWGG